MRYRETNDLSPLYTGTTVAVHGAAWVCENSSIEHENTLEVLTGEFSFIEDVIIKNFKKRSARGEVFNNPLKIHKHRLWITPGTYSYTLPYAGDPDYADISCDYSQDWSREFRGLDVKKGASGHLAVTFDHQALRALAGTQAKANVHAPTVRGAVSIGELRETIGFLKKPFKAYNKWLANVKKDKRKSESAKRKKLPKGETLSPQTVYEFIANNWLAYRYGVRPIVQDLNNLLDALEAVKKKQPERFTARGYASDTKALETDSEHGDFDISRRTVHQLEVRAGVLYELDIDYDHFGVSIEQIPIAVWELTHFSFIADWFANFGPFLEAVTPKAGVNILSTWTTEKLTSNTVTQTTHARSPTPRIHNSASPMTETLYNLNVNRNPGIRVDLDIIPGSLTGEANPFRNAGRIIDLVTIGSGILSSR